MRSWKSNLHWRERCVLRLAIFTLVGQAPNDGRDADYESDGVRCLSGMKQTYGEAYNASWVQCQVLAPPQLQLQQEEEAPNMIIGHYDVDLDRYLVNEQDPESGTLEALEVDWEPLMTGANQQGVTHIMNDLNVNQFMMNQTQVAASPTEHLEVDNGDERRESILAWNRTRSGDGSMAVQDQVTGMHSHAPEIANAGASDVMDDTSLQWCGYLMMNHREKGPDATVNQRYQRAGPVLLQQSPVVQVLAPPSEVQSQQEEDAFDMKGHYDVDLDRYLTNEQNPESGTLEALEVDWEPFATVTDQQGQSAGSSSWDAGADSALKAFVGTAIQECVKADQRAAQLYGKEWMHREGMMSEEGKRVVAEYAVSGIKNVAALKECCRKNKSDFSRCGWRWLHLAGVMQEELGMPKIIDLVDEVERVIPRPAHVSRQCFLANILRSVLARDPLNCRVRLWLSVRNSGWTSSTNLHSNIFPHDFGPLPESQACRRQVALLCFAARWLKRGVQHWLESGTKQFRRTIQFRVVDLLVEELGDRRLREFIALFRARLPPTVQASDTQLMQSLFVHSRITCSRINEYFRTVPASS
ncbi:hypothetical protein GNI_047690 [Gregarina niphandrodes]|uniref:Uncharacterized protein n=1 Tax=Gregarina niphandrodes TaxID=110365 RepID=A0A023B9R7_GRENI|nr:hypothetical protein GNI_047690 [Gregarina niphandrodes]EZG74070.1 hypothetical protein GNI_047690 [Gregarina niphandrodes]|eukprot:XP_011129631.1 hypothetical protein GNI_047690 [Gregarina niphandrodes]